MIDKIKALLFSGERSRRVWLTALIVAAGTLFAAAVCAFYVYILGKPFYPYGTLFCAWPDTFGDIMFPLNTVLGTMQPYQYIGHNYLPLTYVLLWPLRIFPAQTGALFSVFAFLVFMLCYTRINLKNINGGGGAAIIFTFLCYPVFFLAERANVEMLLFALFTAFILTYGKKFFYAAAIILALLISQKIYPAVFLILFVKDKQFKPLLLTVLLSVGFFFLGLALTGNNPHGLAVNLAYFNERYAIGPQGIAFSHTLYALIRLPFTVALNYYSMTIETYKSISSALAFPYMIFCFAFFSLASLIVILKKQAFWKDIFILAACSIWLPYVSFDYTLIWLLPPFFMFTADGEAENKKDIVMYGIIFGLLFIPMNWYWLCDSELWRINIGVPIRTALLGFMLVYIMFKDLSVNELWRDLKLYVSSVIPCRQKPL